MLVKEADISAIITRGQVGSPFSNRSIDLGCAIETNVVDNHGLVGGHVTPDRVSDGGDGDNMFEQSIGNTKKTGRVDMRDRRELLGVRHGTVA